MPEEKISVIIVEDDTEIREGISSFINSTPGFVCNRAYESCEEILDDLKPPLPDVILMDIGLEKMTGIEGVKKLKLKYPELDIIMLTVYEDDNKIFDSLRAGASGYLLKKSPLEKIIDAIHDVKSGGAPMTPSIARKVLNFFSATSNSIEEYNLTRREKEILELLVDGLSYRMIANKLSLSLDTVRTHIKNTYVKLHVNSKAEAMAKVLKHKP